MSKLISLFLILFFLIKCKGYETSPDKIDKGNSFQKHKVFKNTIEEIDQEERLDISIDQMLSVKKYDLNYLTTLRYYQDLPSYNQIEMDINNFSESMSFSVNGNKPLSLDFQTNNSNKKLYNFNFLENDFRYFDNIEITYNSEKKEISGFKKFSIHPYGDPLRKWQWYLYNRAINIYNYQIKNYGIINQDVGKYLDLLQKKYTGRGIRIGIVDDGLEINHEDLKENILLDESKNYFSEYNCDHQTHNEQESDLNRFSCKNPTPDLHQSQHFHGTSVAGIIAAKGWNNIGIRGLAPNSKIAAHNILGSSNAPLYLNMYMNALDGNFDIMNLSFSDYFNLNDRTNNSILKIQDEIYDIIDFNSTKSRNGLGTIYVKAAGNFGLKIDANIDTLNKNNHLIVVGSLNAKGTRSSFSSVGSSLWISSFGGDGIEGGIALSPLIITTDLSGCDRGHALFNPESIVKMNTLNTNCNYTTLLNGTSFAAPIVTAGIALMLEANPNLSLRDIKHILALTSEKVEEDNNHEALNIIHSTNLNFPADVTRSNGWIENAAGFSFHNFYGFGKMNIYKAVTLAENYNIDLKQVENTKDENGFFVYKSGSINLNIPDYSKNGILNIINVQDELIIEQVEIEVEIDHDDAEDIQIYLISPGGTKNLILFSSFIGRPNIHTTLLSNAFYGESSRGDWTIQVVDVKNGTTGILKNWSINFFGRK